MPDPDDTAAKMTAEVKALKALKISVKYIAKEGKDLIGIGTVSSTAACSAQIAILEKEFAKVKKIFNNLKDKHPEDEEIEEQSDRDKSYREAQKVYFALVNEWKTTKLACKTMGNVILEPDRTPAQEGKKVKTARNKVMTELEAELKQAEETVENAKAFRIPS